MERLFRRLKRFRRIYIRYDKLDIVFLAFVYLALAVDSLMRTQSALGCSVDIRFTFPDGEEI